MVATAEVTLDRWLLASEQTAGGTIRRVKYVTSSEWLLIVCTIVPLVASLTFSIYNGVMTDGYSMMFAVLDIINCIFTVFYVLYGVLGERPYEMAALMVSYCLEGMYVSINLVSHTSYIPNLAMCVFVAVFFLPVLRLACVLRRSYRNSGNLLLRSVVDRVDLLRAVDAFYRYQTVLVLHFQTAVSLVLLLCFYPGQSRLMFSPVVVGLGIPLSLISFLLGIALMHLERLWLVVIYCVTTLFVPLCATLVVCNASTLLIFSVTYNLETPMIPIITIFEAVAALIIQIALWFTLVELYRNYGKGVSSTLTRPSPKTQYREQARVSFEAATSSQDTQYKSITNP